MPNLTSILKSEISRLARKEIRATTAKLQKAVTAHRSDIAALKRHVAQLEQQLRQSMRAQRSASKSAASHTPQLEADSPKVRFSAKSLISQRRRLGLSAADCGLLFGTTGQAIYNWESGRARPSAKHLITLSALRNLGKRQAAEIVQARR